MSDTKQPDSSSMQAVDPISQVTIGSGRDLYKERAAELFNVAQADVTPEQRRYAKTVMHAELYSPIPGKSPTEFKLLPQQKEMIEQLKEMLKKSPTPVILWPNRIGRHTSMLAAAAFFGIDRGSPEGDKTTLLTIHKSKGRTFEESTELKPIPPLAIDLEQAGMSDLVRLRTRVRESASKKWEGDFFAFMAEKVNADMTHSTTVTIPLPEMAASLRGGGKTTMVIDSLQDFVNRQSPQPSLEDMIEEKKKKPKWLAHVPPKRSKY